MHQEMSAQRTIHRTSSKAAAFQEFPQRASSQGNMASLADRFEVLKEIGDGSFGSVSLARVRAAGANVARRGTLIAIKTIKKPFDSFSQCLHLREVIFLRTLPHHPHLVPALDIFLDPMTRNLHICMEYMEGNLYQLMKAREHKVIDGSLVKSILYQILGGLDHIHAHNFFHRDIKPENILISTTGSHEVSQSLRRYSSLITPPSTPASYTVKIADFGLARETHSQHPYTTYVSTRWYRAPEVLLRAGEYSAPVDIWALGAMAVEIANLKPLFPGGNEVDQVWRICEIMGSPGNWYDKTGHRVGGGEWREGTRLAQRAGFSFPKMAPHAMDTILRPPQWPAALSNFITWCLMWDPVNRPTASEALRHEYFTDAIDPLRPRSSRSGVLNKKHASIDSKSQKDSMEQPALSTSRSSWFRKSIIRDSSPIVPSQPAAVEEQTRPQVVHSKTTSPEVTESNSTAAKYRPFVNKRATWTNGTNPANAAPMPILPSIRPISPFSNTVTALAHNSANPPPPNPAFDTSASKKIGRQLSVQSNGNHYADLHRQESERAARGQRNIASPNSEQKESFFSHLRKRARRLSGKPQPAAAPEETEVSIGRSPRNSNRNSLVADVNMSNMDTIIEKSFENVEQALQAANEPLPPLTPTSQVPSSHKQMHNVQHGQIPERRPSLTKCASTPALDTAAGSLTASVSPRRRAPRAGGAERKYDVPDEEDELLHEALSSANTAARRMNRRSQSDILQAKKRTEIPTPARQPLATIQPPSNPYPTPSPSARRNGMFFDKTLLSEPVTMNLAKAQPKEVATHRWPTPPYEENEWGASAAASIFAAGSVYQ